MKLKSLFRVLDHLEAYTPILSHSEQFWERGVVVLDHLINSITQEKSDSKGINLLGLSDQHCVDRVLTCMCRLPGCQRGFAG